MAGFEKKVVLIAGATGGIGRALSLELAQRGATLGLLGRSNEKLEALSREARRKGGRIVTYQRDFARDEQIKNLVTEVHRDLGAVDVLVHSAGAIVLGPMASARLEDLDLQYRVNVRAPYALTQALMPDLRAQRGQVVFINSSIWMNARANVAQYAATKYALKAVADSVRDEVNADGVRVISVFLGRTATPMQATVHEWEGAEYRPDRYIQPEEISKVLLDVLATARSAEVTDITLRPMSKTPFGQSEA